jgi:hypothetical protein
MEQLGLICQSVWRLIVDVAGLGEQLLLLAVQWSLLIAWVAWWLCGVNWRKAWPMLARGGWVPLVLIMFVSAHVWSHLEPRSFSLGFTIIPNFWWQLIATGILMSLTLLCGWMQGMLHLEPEDVNLEPPAHTDVHVHALGHDPVGH